METLETETGAPASYDTLATACHEAAARDPRRCGFGYLAGDPTTGAQSLFLWFRTRRELVDFLCTSEIALLQFEPGDADRMAASLRRIVGTAGDLARLDRSALSACFEGWCEILWIGTFADLCSRGGSVQTAVRAAFRTELGLGEHAGPIADDEVDAFVGYLRGAPTAVGARRRDG
jgi:hypothetical protein